MRVVAIAVGFFAGARKRVGAEFDVPDDFKASWVVPAAEAPVTEPVEVREPLALSQLGKGSDAATDFVTAHAGKKGASKKTPPPSDFA